MPPPTDPEKVLAAWLRPQTRGITAFGEHVCIGTRTGAERKANQDRALVARFADPRAGGPVDVFVVCDGMGGMVEGGTCAEVGVASFLLSVARLVLTGHPAPRALFEAVQQANRRVFELFGGRGGTTLVALLSQRGLVTASCVGDSRLFLVRTDGRTIQLSRDDTMKGALDALGQAPAERSPEHERLVQFVGMGNDLEPHVFPVVGLEACRFLLMTTDGAYRLEGDLVANVSRRASTTKQVVERVLHMADWLGGVDDATLIAVAPRSLPMPANEDTEGIIRVWGSAQQQLVLWLSEREVPSFVQRPVATGDVTGRAGAPPPPGKAERQTRGKKSARSRKGRSKEPLPLPVSADLIIKLGDSSTSSPVEEERPPVVVEQAGSTAKDPLDDPRSRDGDD